MCDHFAHGEGALEVNADDSRYFGCIVKWRVAGAGPVRTLWPVQSSDDVANLGERLEFGRGEIVAHSGNAGVHLGAAQRLAVDNLVDGRLHDRRSAEVNPARALHHHHFVGERRNIGAAGGSAAEHGGDLRKTRGGHPALLVEASPEMIAVRKHAILLGQVSAAAVYQIHAGQTVIEGDLLRPQMLLHRLMEKRSALHGRVVGDDHAGRIADHADPGHDSRYWHLAAVQPPGGQRREFEERRQRIDEMIDALPDRYFASRHMAATQTLAAALGHLAVPLPQGRDERLITRGVFVERGVFFRAAPPMIDMEGAPEPETRDAPRSRRVRFPIMPDGGSPSRRPEIAHT